MRKNMDFFLFHRDLRLEDNLGLIELTKVSEKIALIFILTDCQIKANPLLNQFAYNYLIKCLQKLNQITTINIFQGADEITVMRHLVTQYSPRRIYTNFDWTPFSYQRDQQLEQLCQQNDIIYKRFNDYLLFNPGTIMSPKGQMYKVFRFFYEQILTKHHLINPPQAVKLPTFLKLNNARSVELKQYETRPIPVPIKRSQIIQLLQNLDLTNYAKRDYINQPTTLLSTAIKFGIISCRELVTYFHQTHADWNNPFFRQFCWREFYYHTTFWAFQTKNHQLGDNFLSYFNNYRWSNDLEKITAWKKGRTGFPLIDAGMRHLNETGLMPNRLRMIVASFLVKNLHVDWRIGAFYFAEKLLDYDPIVNEASWQWVAGTGFDSNPFYRIFNPTTQMLKFDPGKAFIKKIIDFDKYDLKPIVDLKASRQEALQRYAAIKQRQNTTK